MKKNLSRPGFEFVFGLGIVICLVLPSAIMAKPHKSIQFMISNGDTLINGKSINRLNADERGIIIKHLKTIENRLDKAQK